MSFISRILALFAIGNQSNSVGSTIAQEAKIGGQLFGKTNSPDHIRHFFCLDESTWIWYEEWKDQSGKLRKMSTTYEVRPQGVVKKFNDGHYRGLTTHEKRNFYEATKLYYDYVMRFVHRQVS